MNPLDMVYCKNCKHYRYTKINKYCEAHECLKGNTIKLEEPDLFCNRDCFSKKKKKHKFIRR